MSRMLRIELRRSAAFGAALALSVMGVVLLFFGEGRDWMTGWMQLAMNQRLYLAVLWPLALAAGAWQAQREHRTKVTELFVSTPLPTARRTMPTLGAMAIAVVCGYLVMGLTGVLWVIGLAEYFPMPVFAVVAVGGLALIAAAWLGLAVGRLLPGRVTAPALGVAGLALLLLIPGATRPRGWLALVFSPIYEMNMPGPYPAVPGLASVAQGIWLGALAVTAALLFASNGWRARMAALLPVAVGATLAITVMPHQNRYVVDAIDPVAKTLVCAPGEPRVCVSRVHSGLLDEMTTPARSGLAILAELPGAPREVHEDTSTFSPTVYPPWDDNVVLFHVTVGQDGHLANSTGLLLDVVSGAFDSPPRCDKAAGAAEKLAAASWLIRREPVTGGSYDRPMVGGSYDDPMIVAGAVKRWRELRQLPDIEARARVAALRRAAVSCTVADGQLSRTSS